MLNIQYPLPVKILVSVKAVGVLAVLAGRKGSFKLLGFHKWEGKNYVLAPTMGVLGLVFCNALS